MLPKATGFMFNPSKQITKRQQKILILTAYCHHNLLFLCITQRTPTAGAVSTLWNTLHHHRSYSIIG